MEPFWRMFLLPQRVGLACCIALLVFVGELEPSALAAPAVVQKAAKPLKKEVEKALRLEPSCSGCFPDNGKTCQEELWNRCCSQEIACHDYHCREEVLGQLQANTKVRVRAPFLSDDDARAELTKGMTGRVLRVDGEGDAYVKFWRDEYDDDFQRHWVFRQSFWDALELPERPVRMRAARVATCLDNCTLAMDCRMQEISKSKKKQKTYQACLKGCKFEECNSEEECKALIGAYGACKQRTAESPVCKPEESRSEQSSSKEEL